MSKILNFGSLNLDHVYQVAHFVMPGETLASEGYACLAGGKGLNQSIALKRAGAEVYHAGKIGDDGGMLLEILKQNGVDTRHVLVGSEKTGHAVIQVDRSGQNCILLYGGANKAIDKAEMAGVVGAFSPGDTLVMQNEVNDPNALIHAAKAAGLNVVLNPSPITEELISADLNLVDIFVLNELEAQALTGTHENSAMGEAMARRFPKAQVVLTLGKNGSMYFGNGVCLKQSAFNVPAVDTTAAGDTFLGYFVAQFIAGVSVKDALQTASAAAALAVSKKGAARSIPTMAETRQALAKLC